MPAKVATWCSPAISTSARYWPVTHGEKPSVVQLRSDNLSHENIGRQVVDALRQLTIELEGGALVTVDTERTRLRILPLLTNTEK